jgi:hypothetical protein
MAILMLEQAASLQQVKDAPFSGGYQGHNALMSSTFFQNFQKILATLSRPIARARSFLMEAQTRDK